MQTLTHSPITGKRLPVPIPLPLDHLPEFDRWQTDSADRDYIADPAHRWCRVCLKPRADHYATLEG